MKNLPAERPAWLALALVLAWTSVQAGGRPDDARRDWFWQFGGSYGFSQGDFGDIADDGFGIHGAATYWPSEWPAGLQFEIGYSEFDIASSALRAINDAIQDIDPELGSVGGGDVSDLGFSLNGIWSLDRSTADGFYLIGGIGLSEVEGRLTDTRLVYYPPICDPWWWWCIPGGVGPGTAVVASASSTEFSWNLGVGFSFASAGDSQIFVEARYKAIETDPERTEYVPIVVGFRF